MLVGGARLRAGTASCTSGEQRAARLGCPVSCPANSGPGGAFMRQAERLRRIRSAEWGQETAAKTPSHVCRRLWACPAIRSGDSRQPPPFCRIPSRPRPRARAGVRGRVRHVARGGGGVPDSRAAVVGRPGVARRARAGRRRAGPGHVGRVQVPGVPDARALQRRRAVPDGHVAHGRAPARGRTGRVGDRCLRAPAVAAPAADPSRLARSSLLGTGVICPRTSVPNVRLSLSCHGCEDTLPIFSALGPPQ